MSSFRKHKQEPGTIIILSGFLIILNTWVHKAFSLAYSQNMWSTVPTEQFGHKCHGQRMHRVIFIWLHSLAQGAPLQSASWKTALFPLYPFLYFLPVYDLFFAIFCALADYPVLLLTDPCLFVDFVLACRLVNLHQCLQ